MQPIRIHARAEADGEIHLRGLPILKGQEAEVIVLASGEGGSADKAVLALLQNDPAWTWLKDSSEDVAILLPARRARKTRSPRSRTKADHEAFLSSAGGWRGLVGADEFVAYVYERRRSSSRPPVEVTRRCFAAAQHDRIRVADWLVGRPDALDLLPRLSSEGVAISLVPSLPLLQ